MSFIGPLTYFVPRVGPNIILSLIKDEDKILKLKNKKIKCSMVVNTGRIDECINYKDGTKNLTQESYHI